MPLNLNWMSATLDRLVDLSSEMLRNPIRNGLGNTMPSNQLNAWRRAD